MRYVIGTVLLVFVALFVGACLHDEPGGGSGAPPAKGSAAYNTYCYVCHLNFQKDKLAKRHAKADIGCTRCHGESDRHSADEDNVTPPDIMYAKDKVNPYCMTCHPAKKIARKSAHKPLLSAKAKGKKRCTDCHGEHRIAVRTRRWDKRTGKLLADDGVRMSATQPAQPK